MSYTLRFSSRSLEDLDAVWDDVVEASKDYDTADRYIEDFLQKIGEKKIYPKSGIPLYYRGLFTGFYIVNFKAYKAFYRINEDYIEIIRIIPQKMDYMKVLFIKNEEDWRRKRED